MTSSVDSISDPASLGDGDLDGDGVDTLDGGTGKFGCSSDSSFRKYDGEGEPGTKSKELS